MRKKYGYICYKIICTLLRLFKLFGIHVLIIKCFLWWLFVLPLFSLDHILLSEVTFGCFLLVLVLNLTIKYHYSWLLLFVLSIVFGFYLHWGNRVKSVLFFCLYKYLLRLLNLVSKTLRPFCLRFISELFPLAYSLFSLIYCLLLTFFVTFPYLAPFLRHQQYTRTIFFALFPFVNFPITVLCLVRIVWVGFLLFWSQFCGILQNLNTFGADDWSKRAGLNVLSLRLFGHFLNSFLFSTQPILLSFDERGRVWAMEDWIRIHFWMKRALFKFFIAFFSFPFLLH